MANVLFRKKWDLRTQIPAGLFVAQSIDVSAVADVFGTAPHPANLLFTITKTKPTDGSTAGTGIFYAVAAEGYPGYIASGASLEGTAATAGAYQLNPQGWTAPTSTAAGFLTFTCTSVSVAGAPATAVARALPASMRVNIWAAFAMTATPTV